MTPLEIIARVDRDVEHSAEYVIGDGCALAILAALNQAGYIIVPKEPTAAMIEAGDAECDIYKHGRSTWKAMLKANGESRETANAL